MRNSCHHNICRLDSVRKSGLDSGAAQTRLPHREIRYYFGMNERWRILKFNTALFALIATRAYGLNGPRSKLHVTEPQRWNLAESLELLGPGIERKQPPQSAQRVSLLQPLPPLPFPLEPYNKLKLQWLKPNPKSSNMQMK